jgi:hypothetical protein
VRQRTFRVALTLGVSLTAMSLMGVPVAGRASQQSTATWTPPRTPDGQPDIQGYWGQQSDITTYSIQAGEEDRAEHTRLGGQPPQLGRPIVDPPDGRIPYQPWAADFAAFLLEQHRKPSKPANLDPVTRGFMQGVPRINYQTGSQIMQFPGVVVITYDYGHHYRVIPIDGRPHVGSELKLWMGDSRGHWEGNTLVVDVTNNNDQTWFDIVGSFHSDQLHMVERWTFSSPERIDYIVEMRDPVVHTRPWKLAVTLGRREPLEMWENAVWEGNMLGGLAPEFWGNGLIDKK